MSIILNGLNMPTERESFTLTIKYNGMVLDTETGMQIAEAYELPPHGRLIDADALDTSVLQAGFSYAITRRKLRYTPGEVREKIANAPTIIEAEEGE